LQKVLIHTAIRQLKNQFSEAPGVGGSLLSILDGLEHFNGLRAQFLRVVEA
jgi:hypothetical protein